MQMLKGLVAQVCGLALAALALKFFPTGGLWLLGGLQISAACLISRLLRQPSWWMPIHLLFFPAVLVAQMLHLPGWFYLGGLVLLGLVFWGTVKGDVPLYLSSPAVAEAVIAIADKEQAGRFIDLGAGVGSVAEPLAKRMPNLLVEAWERAPLPWAVTAWRSRRLPNLSVVRGSLWACDLSVYDVVFAFLSPQPMPALGEKLKKEMHAGTLFVSSSFPVPEWRPESVVEVRDRRTTTLYCYRMEASTWS